MARYETLIFGCSALGQAVSRHMTARKIPAILYSQSLDEVGDLLARKFDVAFLDSMDDDKLRDVGIGKWVKTIFCLFEEESKNVFLTLSARALDPALKIVCVAESRTSGQKLLAAGAGKVIDPYEISGRKVHELITRPLITDMLEQTVFGKYIDIAQIRIPEKSCLSGKKLNIEELEGYDVILMGVVDLELSEELIFSTTGVSHSLEAGDMLVVMGLENEIARLKQDIQENRVERLLNRSS